MMRLGALSGCHQLPERSFHIKGYQFPVCARCCGVIVGQGMSIIMMISRVIIGFKTAVAFAFVMFADWSVQYVGIKESNNKRRFITGIFGGLGCWFIIFHMIKKLVCKIKNIRRFIQH